MNINATVFVQMVNFGITYYFLKHILCIPVIERIKQKEAARDLLLKSLQAKDAKLLVLQEQKSQKLQAFRQQMRQLYRVDTRYDQDQLAAFEYQSSEKRRAEIAVKAKAFLLEKVTHGF